MKAVLLAIIRFYQLRVSPLLPPRCRFQPTCSQYTVEAIEKFGLIKGFWLASLRISKCHPFHPGGYDPLDCRDKVSKN